MASHVRRKNASVAVRAKGNHEKRILSLMPADIPEVDGIKTPRPTLTGGDVCCELYGRQSSLSGKNDEDGDRGALNSPVFRRRAGS